MATSWFLGSATEMTVAPGVPITQNGTTTAGSDQVTGLGSVAGLAVGQEITGVGIEAQTTIAAVNAGALSLTLSQDASNSNTVPVTAYPAGTAGDAPAPPPVSRPRQILGASGTWEGRSPNPYLYNFD